MLVSVLAILKAGGAFVPLDGAPRERLRAIVSASAMRVIIAEDQEQRDLSDVIEPARARVLTS